MFVVIFSCYLFVYRTTTTNVEGAVVPTTLRVIVMATAASTFFGFIDLVLYFAFSIVHEGRREVVDHKGFSTGAFGTSDIDGSGLQVLILHGTLCLILDMYFKLPFPVRSDNRKK